MPRHSIYDDFLRRLNTHLKKQAKSLSEIIALPADTEFEEKSGISNLRTQARELQFLSETLLSSTEELLETTNPLVQRKIYEDIKTTKRNRYHIDKETHP